MDNTAHDHEHRERWRRPCTGASSGIYGLAFIGAAAYYLQYASSFQAGVLGFLKALVWPAILAYKAFEFFYK